MTAGTAGTAQPTRVVRAPAIDRVTAERLMRTEYRRVIDQLRSLSSQDWQAPTCNTGWDVRALSAHMLGMAAMAASLREQIWQMRTAKRRGGEFIDALTALQVEKYEGWTSQRIITEFERLAPKAIKGRNRMPGLMRRRRMPDDQPVNPPHEYEPWTFAYLVDVILTRDPWMHRTDIAAATGRELTLTDDHDAVIVDDVAREWAGRHGQACTLTLTGPLSRRYEFGPGGSTADAGGQPGAATGPSYTLDPIAFCRILSGRQSGDGLLATRVPF